MRRALCLWLPSWPIQRLWHARPELRGRPTVLHEQRRGTTKVVACSQRAYHGGVFPGMSLAEAAALPLEGLHLEQHDPVADRQALEQLAIDCESFSPLVGLEEGLEKTINWWKQSRFATNNS